MKQTHPIHFFGPNSDVLIRLAQFRYCAENHAGVAFNAPIRAGNETMHRFIQKRNERAKSTLMDPIVLFWFVWVSFVTVPKTMPVLHLMHRSGPKRNDAPIRPARNERDQSTFLDPIVMFWFVWVSFVTVPKTMPVLHLMHRSGPEMKRCTDSSRNETNVPNPHLWTQ